MKKPSYFNSVCHFALSNIQMKPGLNTVNLQDAVEDSSTAQELKANINAITRFEKFEIDRVTPDYVRLISVDPLGNKHYLKAEF